MAKKPRDPDKGDKKIADQWDDGEDFGGYCPKCQTHYSAAQASAHAGH